MKASFFFSLLSLNIVFLAVVAQTNNGNDQVYIVYMGGPAPANRDSPVQILMNNLLRRNKNAIVHSYKHGFSGFAAYLSEQEAHQMARQEGVVSVFKDPILKLHTTRSWDFLQYQTSVEIQSSSPLAPSSSSYSAAAAAASGTQGSDTIIGILDTGIWPESESFNDKDMGPIPSRWKGTCMESKDFPASKCNRKLIGARYYKDLGSSVTQTARDSFGHGTHVASTAAGYSVSNVSYYGFAEGTAKGGSPDSHIAMYRVCVFGCRGSTILAGFDDAIADGVDVLSLSLGSSLFDEYSTDPIAIGSFHAVQKGIMVVCSAGNGGPHRTTVVNDAPWILTVAATTIDRSFESDVVLGNGDVIKGEAINFANLQDKPTYPLINSVSAKTNSSLISSARSCEPSSLEDDMIKGKIVFCSGGDDSLMAISTVASQGAVGVIVANDEDRFEAIKSLKFPATVISSKDAASILTYINSTGNPVATISKTTTTTQFKPAPTLAAFSSRGPSYSTRNILKPDIAAPGVNILAAWLGNDTKGTLPGMKPTQYNLISGTSMSCPHVSGIAATVKSHNPTWSPAAIRSAIMTTAIQTNNMKGPLTTHTGDIATPYEYGAGEMNPPAALNPGLVYDTDPADYIQFLCNYGYNSTQIKLLQPSLPKGFNCPKDSNKDMIWNLNYPSISVSKDIAKSGSIIVTRMLTNVGEGGEYKVKVNAPSGLDVKVAPETLSFTSTSQKLSFQVVFSLSSSGSSVNKEMFGTITWSNGKNDVRSPFVLTRK